MRSKGSPLVASCSDWNHAEGLEAALEDDFDSSRKSRAWAVLMKNFDPLVERKCRRGRGKFGEEHPEWLVQVRWPVMEHDFGRFPQRRPRRKY